MRARIIACALAMSALGLVATPPAPAAAPQKHAPAKRAVIRPQIPAAEPAPLTNPFTVAEPDDATLAVKLSDDGKTIFLAGALVSGSYRKFARVLGTAPLVKTVHLGSPGGLVLEGFLIAALVREKRLDTYSEVHCASSCTQILVSGINRAASPKAVIGFHKSGEILPDGLAGPAAKPKSRFEAKSDQDLLFKLPFQRAGVDSGFIDQAFSTPHESIWHPDHGEMLRAKFLTRVSAGHEFSVPDGIGINRTEAEAALLSDQIWSLLQQRQPMQFDKAVVQLQELTQVGISRSEALPAVMARLPSELAGAIALGSDMLVDQFLTLTKDQMAEFPEVMFPSCARAEGNQVDVIPVVPPELAARERRLIIALLSETEQAKALSQSKAIKLLSANLRPATLPPAGTTPDAHACADSMQVVRELIALPTKQRISTFRALLTLGNTMP